MSYGVTDTGWISKSQQTLLDEINDDCESTFGESFPTTPDSVTGQYNNIIAAALKSLYDLGEAITDSQIRSTSEGAYLNWLANLIGLSRLEASGSTGYLLFTCNNGTTIAESTSCTDTDSRVVYTDEEGEATKSACYQATVSPASAVEGEEYTVVVEGTTYTYTATSGVNRRDNC